MRTVIALGVLALVLLLAACGTSNDAPSATPSPATTRSAAPASREPAGSPTPTPRPTILPSPTVDADGVSPYEPVIFLADTPYSAAGVLAENGWDITGLEADDAASKTSFRGERGDASLRITGSDHALPVYGPDGEQVETPPQLQIDGITLSGERPDLRDVLRLVAPEAEAWLEQALKAGGGEISLGYADLELTNEGGDWELTISAPASE